jgi:hypothetical protein
MRRGVDSLQNKNKQFMRSDDFVFRRIENETILVPIRDNVADLGCIYSLNEVGAFIWQQLDGQASLQDIAGRISAEFEVTLDTAADDLAGFLDELESIQAVTPIGSSVPEQIGSHGRPTRKY